MKFSRSLIAILMVLIAASWLSAQSRGSAEATIDGKAIKIEYGRPNLQGRQNPQNELAVGDVWRLGMNQATELHSDADLNFGDLQVPAGSYSLFAKKVEGNKWHLLINKQTGQWGTQHDPSQDLFEIPLSLRSHARVEKFTIEVKQTGDQSGSFSFSWGTSSLHTDFTVE